MENMIVLFMAYVLYRDAGEEDRALKCRNILVDEIESQVISDFQRK